MNFVDYFNRNRYYCQEWKKRKEVLLNVWGNDDYLLRGSIDVFITKLRKHFKESPEIQLKTIQWGWIHAEYQ